VLWGFGDRNELQAAGASRLIEHPAELHNSIHSFT
jgi:phosphoglycolate phosphatase-like HAD superfamily hydrolase